MQQARKAPAKVVPDPAGSALGSLLRHFRAQRPLRAGSLLITIFGDSIAPRGGAVTLGSLIRLGQPFGLNERLVRTSVARLAREGWLSTRRSGRRSEYRLTAMGATRFAQATRRIYSEGPTSWHGQWTFLLLPGKGATQRSAAAQRRAAALRDGLRWLGFGQLSPTLFAHPGPDEALLRDAQALPGAKLAVVLAAAATDSGGDPRLVEQGWDLQELGARYRRFVATVAPVLSHLARAVPPAETAFVIRTLLIHEYRKIHLQDPLLPRALLPARWEGANAHALCGRAYRRVFGAAEEHLTACAERLDEPLPRVDPAALQRFA